MKICLFGAGSLGCALGGILAEKNDVTLIGRFRNMRAIRTNGLKLLGDRRAIVHPDARESISGLDPPELLIVSTKSYETKNAVSSCRTWASDETMVLTLQNGLGNFEMLRAWKSEKAFGGTTTIGANMVSPGTVRISGMGSTVIGSDMDHESAERIVSAFRSCGLNASVTSEITSAIWAKAIINACINPTAAVLRVPNGKLTSSAVISRFMRDVCHECECVANGSGAVHFSKSLYPRVRAVCRDTSENLSSMVQDVLQGKRTEIDHINGAICDQGDRLAISTPLNDALVAMISSLDVKSSKQKS